MQVFYTGLEPQTASVALNADQIVRRDFDLPPVTTTRGSQAGENVLKLDQFVVDSARDTNAASIAIIEQRFAGNIKTVLQPMRWVGTL